MHRWSPDDISDRRGGDSNPRYEFTPYDGLANHRSDPVTTDQGESYRPRSRVSAGCLALAAQGSHDLAIIIERWDSLPDDIKTSIVAIVRATSD